VSITITFQRLDLCDLRNCSEGLEPVATVAKRIGTMPHLIPGRVGVAAAWEIPFGRVRLGESYYVITDTIGHEHSGFNSPRRIRRGAGVKLF
jgi:hypothetical protein